ncbi:CoA transferase [Caulobacter sp. KR2-114]|uniref:CaiB/BaiF CoA-transferase family protein n=1 Tax=Caulobacter sp. KR2-114 TaxID=3400912 RepID=UPI003C107D13
MSAFAGLRVLDFSGYFVGAMAAMHLADFGAEVIKLDPTGVERGLTEPGYLAWNRNKQRLVLDIGTPDGLAAARTLIAGADVAIFDQPPGVLAGLGLDAETLTAAHPRLVHAWAPPYGETGRWSGFPPSHTLLSAITSIAMRQPSYAHSPVHLVTPQAYYAQANCLAAAIGAALVERERSGQGQGVVVTGLNGAAQVVSGTVLHGAPPAVLWTSPRGGAPSYRLYECADGLFLFLGTLFPNFYMRALDATDVLGEVLVHPEIDGDLDAALVQPGAFVTLALLQEKFLTRPRAEWLEVLQAADVPCGPVGTREAWFSGPTVAANRIRLELDHPELGVVSMPGSSVRLAGTPAVEPRLCRTVDLEAIPARAIAEAPAGAGAAAAAAPLAGVKILDLGNVIAAPYAATILASFGADVIKVEGPEGDPFRNPPTFLSYNRGKRGLALDLKQDAARQVFLEMVAGADVVLDNFRYGVRERLGITYEQLRQINPRIISLSVTGYGDDVARQTLPAFDPLLQAESGLMQAQGGEDDEPVFHAIPVNDVTTAAMSAFAIVAALLARERTGEGQEISTSLATTSVMAQIGQLVSFAGAPPAAMGSRDCLGSSALERFYECEGGWIALACPTEAHYRGLCEALGLEPGDAAAALTAPRDGPLAAAIAAALRPLDRAEALARLDAAGVPAAPVITAPETYADPFLAENGYLETYAHPKGTVTGATGYARFLRTPARFPHPAPLLAQHSLEVLRDYGVAEDRIAALVESGAVLQA